MKYEEIVSTLQEMADEKRQLQNAKRGLGDNNLGIPLGKLRTFGKKLEMDHGLGLQLWNSGIYELMLLGTMVMDPNKVEEKNASDDLKKAFINDLVDEYSFNLMAKSKDRKEIADRWMKSKDDNKGRAGWNIHILRVIDGEIQPKEMEKLLGFIDDNLKGSKDGTKWAMNRCLCEIGIRNEKYRARALEIGERLEVYKEMKVSKGCTSAYAPSWIYAVVSKNKKVIEKKKTPIDQYIETQLVDRQERLRYLREIILEVIPESEEKLAWAMPTFKFEGKNCIHFCNHKNHIGIYPGPSAIVHFAKELEGYVTSKGAIQIPIDKPIPSALIQKIVKFSMEENRKKKK